MQIIRKREIVEDGWVHVADDADVPPDADVVVSLQRWRSQRETLKGHAGRLGVRLDNTIDPLELREDLPHLALVAVEFPVYRDGRGFSIARLLRERMGYAGEIRAVGNVLRDQLYFMERCGFDTYELEDGKSLESALAAFDEFSVTYQDAVDPRRVPRDR